MCIRDREWGHNWTAITTAPIHDADTARQALKLLDCLDELDDVRSVNANLDLPDDLELSS